MGPFGRPLPRLLLLLFLCGVSHAQSAAQAVRAAEPVTLDGVLDETAWDAAQWQGDFVSASAASENAGEPRPAEVQTRFKVLYDDWGLWVAVECDEPSPDAIKADTLEHDGTVWADDCIELFFDPAGEGRYYHHFLINTRGVWYDDYGADYGLVHGKLWDCAIETAASVDAAAAKWTVEVRIPFGGLILNEDAGSDWLWNVTRERHAGGELQLSTWTPLKGNFHQPRLFGKLSGVDVDFRRFAFDLGEPKVAISRDAGGATKLGITTRVKNHSGTSRRLLGTLELFPEGAGPVSTEPVALPVGAEADLAFPDLTLTGSLAQARCLIALSDAATGMLYKSAIRRVSAQYKPLSITVLRPCYRNCIYATEKLSQIVFRAHMAPDVAAAAKSLRCHLEDSAGRFDVGSTVLGGLQGEHTVRAPEAVGTYRLVVEAYDAEGKVLATETQIIRKLPPPTAGNEVRIDEHGNILLNGTPFVGIGWYGSVPTDDPRADVVALQNLQTPVVPIAPDVSGITKAFDEHGIRSVVSIENGRLTYVFGLWREPGHTVPEEHRTLSSPSGEAREFFRRLIEMVRAQPGLVSYYIADEPEISNTRSDYLESLYEFFRQEDPYHPVIVTNDTLDGIVTHGYKCADILAPDPYSPNYDYVPNFLKRCHEVLRPGQTIMLTPWHASSQAHTTADYGSAPPYPYRVFRNQYLVSLAYGCRAWIGYTDPFFMPEIEYRYGLPYVWREVKFLEQAMAQPAPRDRPAVEADAEMAAWLRSCGGHVYLVVVNHKPGVREATIAHPLLEGLSELIVMSEGRRVNLAEGGFSDHFEEGDARIYTTDPAAADFPTTAEVEAELARRQAETAKPGNLLHVSRGTRASASDGHYAPWFDQFYYYAINGITDDMGWAVTHAGDRPASLELTMQQAHPIGRVVIHTPNLRDYDLQLQGPDGEVHRAEIRGNEQTVVEHNLSPAVPCLKVRVTALSSRQGARQVSEIEAYERPGDGPVTPLTLESAAPEAPQALTFPADEGENALWQDDFTQFTPAETYNWDGKDTNWVLQAERFSAEPVAGGGVVCASRALKGSNMTHIFPYSRDYRYFQVNLSDIEGEGYQFTNVGFTSSSGKPGYRGAVNTSRPGIYTVDTHYIHESYRDGSAANCFVNAFMAGASELPDGTVQPGPRFTFDWMRLVKRPVDGLAVSMADDAPLPAALKRGDEVLLQLLLSAPAADAVVDVMTGHSYSPLPINGAPGVQLLRVGKRDGRQWAAKVLLGEGTGRFDQATTGYPVVFRARITGGAIQETYFTAQVSFE